MSRAGDGSTLTLDFTTGLLDPRLSFERLSTATFINSSGLVQWADSNLFYNSTWTDANNTPALWSAGSGTASRSNETRTFTTSASQVYITQTRSTDSGIRYSASVEVTAITGTQRVDDVIVALGGSSYQYYFNGSAVSGTTSLTPGIVGLAFTAGAATTTVRVGSGVQGTNKTRAVTLRYPQFEPGTVASRIYRPNSSTTSSYQAPRFDHDPTTLAPKGLLIEGQAVNISTYSEDYSQAAWSKVNIARTTGQSSPDNATGATLIAENTTSFVKHSLERSITITPGVHTFSVWAKEPSTDSRRYLCVQVADGQATAARYTIVADLQTGTITASGANNGTAGAPTNTGHSITAYPNGWYRLTVTMNCVASPVYPAVMLSNISTLFGGSNQPFYSATTPYTGIIVWGAQLEDGSGASSYIPTGASTATRNRDQVALTNLSSINFSQTEGTCLATVEVREKADSTFLPYGSFDTSGGGRCWWWLRHNLSTVAGTRLLGTAFNSGGSGVLNTSNYVYNGGSGGVVKFATSLDTAASSMVFVIAGGAPQTTTAAAFTLATAAQWGLNTSTDTVATALGSMWVQSFKYWPTKLSNAQLQSLTL
jgi:hypothetical protein